MYNGMQNANMAQKSLIQTILENNARLESLKHAISNLMEQYMVNDNVFGLHGNTPVEFKAGYFVVECEKDNLQDAIREIDSPEKCIRVIENKTFQVGTIHHYLNECGSGTVLDIESQNVIER